MNIGNVLLQKIALSNLNYKMHMNLNDGIGSRFGYITLSMNIHIILLWNMRRNIVNLTTHRIRKI